MGHRGGVEAAGLQTSRGLLACVYLPFGAGGHSGGGRGGGGGRSMVLGGRSGWKEEGKDRCTRSHSVAQASVVPHVHGMSTSSSKRSSRSNSSRKSSASLSESTGSKSSRRRSNGSRSESAGSSSSTSSRKSETPCPSICGNKTSNTSLPDNSGWEPWDVHVSERGADCGCVRCVYERSRRNWHKKLTYEDADGVESTWLEQCPSGSWALGCKVCRWAGVRNIYGRGEARGENCRFVKLRRHQDTPSHQRAVALLLRGRRHAVDAEVLAPDDRHDVPCFSICYTAWKGAKRGNSFTTFTDDLKLCRDVGGAVPQSRTSRKVAQKLVECFGAELQSQDKALLRQATHLHLTMDARRNHLVVRVRMVLSSLPEGMVKAQGPLSVEDGDFCECPTPLPNVWGENILRADRMLRFQRLGPYASTMDLSKALESALHDACGGDDLLWEQVRARVFAFTPDGAYDEQLAGKLTCGGQNPTFPNLRLVLRCSAHALQGGIAAGWKADPLSNDLTKSVVQEVAKYARHSDRFAARLTAKQASEAIAELSNFSFAPQRFSSRERPLTRFCVFAESILETLALEVMVPTSKERKQWAQKILQKLDTSAWVCISMLADLADDCSRFCRTCDRQRLDPVEFWQAYKNFRQFLKREYVLGGMWMRRDTHSHRMVAFLSETRASVVEGVHMVIRRPTRRESELCQAHVANVAEGILTYLKAEFPDFSAQAKFSCFQLGGESDPATLKQLLQVMGWSHERSIACEEQYMAVWPIAKRVKKDKNLTDAQAWDCSLGPLRPENHEELRDIISILCSFLISETECERNFSLERKQFEGRPRLSAEMRFAGLKVITDGAPLEWLQRDGRPVGRFWQAIQQRYAEKFGCRFLLTVAPRRDKGVKRPHVGKTRGGKVTLSHIQRQRAQAVRQPASTGHTNIFGYSPAAAADMERLRLEERDALFSKLLEKARKKFAEKRRQYLGTRNGQAQCSLDPQHMRRLLKTYADRRKKCSTSAVFGGQPASWQQLLRKLGGEPWVFSEEALPAHPQFGGRKLWTDDAADFVRNLGRGLGRRIVLVKDAALIREELRFLAALVGAYVQEKLLIPLLRCRLRRPVTLAFTKRAAARHAQVVKLACVAATRPESPAFPAVRVLRRADLLQAIDDRMTKQDLLQHCLVYADDQDELLQGLTKQQTACARTFLEFLGTYVIVEGVRW